MASVGFGAVAPAVASPAARATSLAGAGRRARSSATAHVPAATKVVTAAAAKQEKGLFDSIFGALYKEEQLLETDPVLNKVQSKAPSSPLPKKAAAAAAAPEESGGFSLGGFFSKPKKG